MWGKKKNHGASLHFCTNQDIILGLKAREKKLLLQHQTDGYGGALVRSGGAVPVLGAQPWTISSQSVYQPGILGAPKTKMTF